MSSYSLASWAEFCDLHSSTPLPEDVHFEHLFIDTREIVNGSGGVFFASRDDVMGMSLYKTRLTKGF